MVGQAIGAWSLRDTSIDTTGTSLGIINNLHAVTVTSTTIRLQWSRRFVDHYDVRYRVKGSTDDYTVERSTDFRYTVSRLTPNTIYEFAIRPATTENVGIWSNIIFVRTVSLGANPPAPTGLRLVSVEEATATLAWSTDLGYVDYRLAWYIDGTFVNSAITDHQFEKDQLVVTGLQPNTEYTFTIRGRVGTISDTDRRFQVSEESAPITVTTLSE